MAYPDFYGATGKNKPLKPRGAQQHGYNLVARLASGVGAAAPAAGQAAGSFTDGLVQGMHNVMAGPFSRKRPKPITPRPSLPQAAQQQTAVPFMQQLTQDYQQFAQGPKPNLEQQLSQRGHSAILEAPTPAQAPIPSFDMPQPTGKLAEQIEAARQPKPIDREAVIAGSPTIQALRALRQRSGTGGRRPRPEIDPRSLGVVGGADSAVPFQQRSGQLSLQSALSAPGAVQTPDGTRVHPVSLSSGIPLSNRVGANTVALGSDGRAHFVEARPSSNRSLEERLAYAQQRQAVREASRGVSPSGKSPSGIPMTTPEMVAANQSYQQFIAPDDQRPLFSDVRSSSPAGIDLSQALATAQPVSLDDVNPVASMPRVNANRQRREEELAERNAAVQSNAAQRAAARRDRLEARNQPPNLMSMLAMRNPRFALEMARLNQQGQIAQMENALRRELGMADVDVRREGVDVQRQGVANQHELGMGGLDLRREGLQQEGDLARQRLQQDQAQFEAALQQRNLDQMASGFLDPEMSSEVQASLFDQWNQERRPGGVDLQGALSDPALAAPQANPFRSGVRGVDQIPEGAELPTVLDSLMASNPEITDENREQIRQALLGSGTSTEDLIAYLDQIDPSRQWWLTQDPRMPENRDFRSWISQVVMGQGESPEETAVRQRRLRWLKSLLPSGN